MASKNDYTASSEALTRQHAATPAEAIKKHKAFLEARLPQLAKWVRGGVRPEALLRFELLDLQQNQKLRECSPDSIYLALLACAVTGLEPGSLHGHAYLVPFGGKAQFMIGYRGLIKLAKRSGEVQNVFANVVYERDTFDIDLGSDARVSHKPCLGDRGDILGVYAVAKMAHGSPEIEWMSKDDLDRIRKVAEGRGKSPAWSAWPEEMMKKSAIRRMSKRLPLGHDYLISQAIEHAQEEDGDATPVLDLETDNEASKTTAQLAAAPKVVDIQEEPAFDPTDIAEENKEIERLERQSKTR